jgi:hypothetical protein
MARNNNPDDLEQGQMDIADSKGIHGNHPGQGTVNMSLIV